MRLYLGAALLAGRATEAELLTAAVQDSALGRLRAVVVHGEAGIGLDKVDDLLL
jgi:hypothetical protein